MLTVVMMILGHIQSSANNSDMTKQSWLLQIANRNCYTAYLKSPISDHHIDLSYFTF